MLIKRIEPQLITLNILCKQIKSTLIFNLVGDLYVR